MYSIEDLEKKLADLEHQLSALVNNGNAIQGAIQFTKILIAEAKAKLEKKENDKA